MKKPFIIIFLLLALHICAYAQIDAPTNVAAIGLGATSPSSNYKFTFQNYSVAHYGLGWYTEASGSPAAYLSGYAGIKFFSSGQLAMNLRQNGELNVPGNLCLGTTESHGYKLAVNGDVIANSVTVKAYPWADFVFNRDYNLRPLAEVSDYIDKNHHLPDIPSAREIARDGLDLGQMNKLLMQKIEELTLYLLDQHQQIETLKKKNEIAESQEQRIKNLEKRLESISK